MVERHDDARRLLDPDAVLWRVAYIIDEQVH
jgi:hypothetical protein